MKYIDNRLNAKIVKLEDANNNFASENVEDALEEIDSKIKNIETNGYDDTKIKQDINNIKNELGTEELTTNDKNIKGAVNEVSSQIKDINNKLDNNKIKKMICFYTDSKITLDDAKVTMDNIKKIGADWVLLSVSISLELSTNEPKTWVNDNYVDSLIKYAQLIGLNVALKLHTVPSDGDGTNDYKPTNLTLWFNNYKLLVLNQAQLCLNNNIEYFLISNELKSITTNEFKSYWLDIINELKLNYPNLNIGSSVNMNEAMSYSLFDELDFYGLNIYPRLTKKGLNASDKELRSGFYYDLNGYECIPFISNLKNNYKEKEIWISETGCQPHENALNNPSGWDNSYPYNESYQKLYYELALDILFNTSSISAISIWVANTIDNFTFFNRQAEDVIKKYFGGEN